MKIRDLAKEVIAKAQACNATLISAESCTAGAVAYALSEVPGAGTTLNGGIIAYTKAMKNQVLHVPDDLLKAKGAVCAEVAEAMAHGALRMSSADIAVAVTGVAGPEPDEDQNPVGLVYCSALARGKDALTTRHFFSNISREKVIESSVAAALDLLRRVCC